MVIRLILLLVNIVLINAAFLLSFLIRLGIHIPAFNIAPYKDSYIFLTLVYMLAFAFTGVYKKRFPSFSEKSIISPVFKLKRFLAFTGIVTCPLVLNLQAPNIFSLNRVHLPSWKVGKCLYVLPPTLLTCKSCQEKNENRSNSTR